MMPPTHPIIAISYSDDTRNALAESVAPFGVTAIGCSGFSEAEDLALTGIFNGILVDLQSIIKAKGDEKLIACSLTGFYPTLRVRALGSVLVPMAMPGDARQDKSIADFLNKTCAAFTPRPLRRHKRKDLGLSVLARHARRELRTFVANLSWGGAFLVDMASDQFQPGEPVELVVGDSGLIVDASVCWLRPWGDQRLPGFGVCFGDLADPQTQLLLNLLKHDRSNSRDRMVAR